MQIVYVLVFLQMLVKRECYMKTPKVIAVHSNREWLIKVKKNIYGQLQAGRVWNKCLVEKLTQSRLTSVRSTAERASIYYTLEIIFCQDQMRKKIGILYLTSRRQVCASPKREILKNS